MITISEERVCCGCSACEDVCPKKSISMIEGSLGHLFPIVDNSTCIDCDLCSKVCPIKNKLNYDKQAQKAYIAYNTSKEIRLQSSSGGMFYSLASHLLDEDFYIFGAYFDESLKLVTGYVTSEKDLIKMCKSKYLQSSMQGIYKKIKELLDKGCKVAFFGTPCQNHAIKLFLKKQYENLVLVDFFCHGVPSQKYFDQCKELVENRDGIKILKYQYRTKVTNGCTPHYFSIDYEINGKVKRKTDYYFKSPNYAAFQTYINLRESCYDCRFATKDRASDITLGDFHNIDKYNSKIDRFDGVSTLIINTERGQRIIDSISHNLYLEAVDIDILIRNKEIFSGGTKRPLSREEFKEDYETLSFKELNKKWFGRRRYIKQIVYYNLPSCIRRVLKKILRAE